MKENDAQAGKSDGFGRREFGQRAALALTGAAFVGTPLAGLGRDFAGASLSAPFEQDQEGSGLSAQAHAEVEAKVQDVIATYGSRLNEDQKKMIRRTITEHVRMLEAVRPIPVGNGDAPATVLKLVEGKTSQNTKQED